MRSTLVDIEVVYQFETDKAVCIREDETSKRDIWLPKSQCEINTPSPRRGDVVEITAEEWILTEKGLV